MTASRIGQRAPQREVEIEFDGARIRAVEGEPVAASLLVAGRGILSRSFRFHRPRGLMCSTGQCGWCECEVDGVPSVRTCRLLARDGLAVRSEHALPSVGRDILGLLDWGSRLAPPTFYHHRFLRPRFLRKAYLDVLRWFGGRGHLLASRTAWKPGGELRRERVDVVVIGAGTSGLAAAAGARRAGAKVMVLEADVPPFWNPPAYGAASPGAGDHDGMDIRPGTTTLGWYGGVVGVVDRHGTFEVEAGAVVVATGTYERVPLVGGADRPGVLSARLVARLIERHAILPGRRAILVGEAESLAGVGALLARAGASVAGPYATASLLAVNGRRRVSGVRLRDGAGTRVEPADIVVFSDRAPSVELLLQAGAATAGDAAGPSALVDGAGRTSVPGVFAVGGAVGPAGRQQDAMAAGTEAAAYAAASQGGDAPAWDGCAPMRRTRFAGTPDRRHRDGTGCSVPGTPHGQSPPPGAIVCFCEDVRVREVVTEVHAGYGDPELLKRRTGALTGPCQGKYCLAALACTAASAAPDGGPGAQPDAGAWLPPTGRPPVRPVRLGDLAGAHPLAVADEA
ncbi:MAG TPA: (2Fe-2S)-binding protein [Candidatus Limnocylindria bacterium]|nr:(2Fe-2S)-binding protein [Candidatus Limnocylindria bacterium]